MLHASDMDRQVSPAYAAHVKEQSRRWRSCALTRHVLMKARVPSTQRVMVMIDAYGKRAYDRCRTQDANNVDTKVAIK